jgi:putative CocE/NonD family hydrolase
MALKFLVLFRLAALSIGFALVPALCPVALAQQTTQASPGPPRPFSDYALRPEASQAQYDIVIEHTAITTRDGVKLSTDIHRPAKNGVAVEGKFPVILERTPYGKQTARAWAPYFVPRGYIGVIQDIRGRYESEGHWWPMRDDPNDGYDTAKWIGEQPWCNGKIGTVGTSYPGGTQHALAISNPPYLAAMVPTDAMSDVGRFGIRHEGTFELRWVNWIFNIGGPAGSHESRDPATKAAIDEAGKHISDYVKGMPLRQGTTPLRLLPDYESWLIEAQRHSNYDDYWKNFGTSVIDHVAEYKDVPVYHVGGWYDSWDAMTSNLNYATLARTKHNQRLIMGPWTHGGQTHSNAGDADFGPDAAIDFNAFRLRWFDRWLKGIDNHIEADAPVRIFVMGGGDAHRTAEGRLSVGGRWRDEHEWPLARTKYTPWYLHADGILSPEKPTGSDLPSVYLFDPRNPVPTLGGGISSENCNRAADPKCTDLMPRGAVDQKCRPDYWACNGDSRPLSARNDILVFQSAPLEQDMEVTGPLVVKLWISSTAPDTDFTAKLIDVYPPNRDFPAGVDLNVNDGITRARYRNTLAKPELMERGGIYPITIELYPTSLVFKKGHRIRVDISSSNFPRFEVNPNTNELVGQNRRWAIAENGVYHDPQHPSHILLPVIPAQ